MGRTACPEPQCLYKGALNLLLYHVRLTSHGLLTYTLRELRLHQFYLDSKLFHSFRSISMDLRKAAILSRMTIGYN